MESSPAKSKARSCTTVKPPAQRSATLVLRSKVDNLKDEVQSDLEKKAEELKVSHKNKSPEEITKDVHETIQEEKRKTMKCFDEMEKEITKHAPKPPKRQEGESDASYKEKERAYQEEVRHYSQLAETSIKILKRITGLFHDVFVKVKEFFNDLWNWIKQAMKNIGQKIASFFKMIGETITAGLDELFG